MICVSVWRVFYTSHVCPSRNYHITLHCIQWDTLLWNATCLNGHCITNIGDEFFGMYFSLPARLKIEFHIFMFTSSFRFQFQSLTRDDSHRGFIIIMLNRHDVTRIDDVPTEWMSAVTVSIKVVDALQVSVGDYAKALLMMSHYIVIISIQFRCVCV
jgi:hypothetical protein